MPLWPVLTAHLPILDLHTKRHFQSDMGISSQETWLFFAHFLLAQPSIRYRHQKGETFQTETQGDSKSHVVCEFQSQFLKHPVLGKTKLLCKISIKKVVCALQKIAHRFLLAFANSKMGQNFLVCKIDKWCYGPSSRPVWKMAHEFHQYEWSNFLIKIPLFREILDVLPGSIKGLEVGSFKDDLHNKRGCYFAGIISDLLSQGQQALNWIHQNMNKEKQELN